MAETKTAPQSEEECYYETGKRKSAIARVYMRQGSGKVTVNKKPLEKYFPREHSQVTCLKPLDVTNLSNKFDITATVKGGGINSQAEALRHGIARAILQYNDTFRKLLKDTGLLTRDPRMKERKKYGKKGARAGYQFSKR